MENFINNNPVHERPVSIHLSRSPSCAALSDVTRPLSDITRPIIAQHVSQAMNRPDSPLHGHVHKIAHEGAPTSMAEPGDAHESHELFYPEASAQSYERSPLHNTESSTEPSTEPSDVHGQDADDQTVLALTNPQRALASASESAHLQKTKEPASKALQQEFMLAIMTKNVKDVNALLAEEFDLNQVHGSTALMWATRVLPIPQKSMQIVSAILAKGADVNKQDADGCTALMHAVGGGDVQIVNAILANGADVNIQDSNGSTALMAAIERLPNDTLLAYRRMGGEVGGDLQIVNALLEKGADVNNIRDNNGNTAFTLVEEGLPNEKYMLAMWAILEKTSNAAS